MPRPAHPLVASIGDNCVDRYVAPLPRTHIGGNAVNVAVGLARAGLRTMYAGAVGDDADGRAVLDALAREGVDARAVTVRRGEPTGMCRVELRAGGERVFLDELVGASGHWLPTRADVDALNRCVWVHAAGLHADPGALANLGGPLISFDVSHHGRPLLPQIAPRLEIAFFSGERGGRDGALVLAQEAVALGARAAVVTRGREGALAFDGALVEVAAEPVQVVDTLGAGDALIAAVIAARIDGADMAAALGAGARAAARACGHYGAWEPADKEVPSG
jgi:fructoselysine 6-kinase